MNDIKKIVITGGPCAGKSSLIPKLQKSLENLNYKVLVLPEVATELISCGISPQTCKNAAEYQKLQLFLQTTKEKIYLNAAGQMNEDKIIILCDRGAMDSKAYMSEQEFSDAILALGYTETELRDSYDAVFHLTSAAVEVENEYTLSGNTARTETAAEAKALDSKTLAAWVGNPHLRVVAGNKDFAVKEKSLLSEVMFFLGEPEPLEIERKYLIKYPDLAALDNNPLCQKSEIFQSYVENAGKRFRLRKRGEKGNYTYYKTEKVSLDGIRRTEIETRLSFEEYQDLLTSAEKRTDINKIRYCLVFNNKYFEIDIFDFSLDKAFMEIELKSEDEKFDFPPFIEVIREVSEDREYRNSVLANKLAAGIIPF